MTTKKPKHSLRSRYEFRVWGSKNEAHQRLLDMAEPVGEEQVEDCYLLMSDPSCNLKIRRNRFKIKRLVEERFGFQRWSRDWYDTTEEGPVAVGQGGLAAGVDHGQDQLHPVVNLRPVFVTKHRRRFRFDSMRAEVTDLEIGGRPDLLRTTAIEGRNLVDLIKLRSSLGLDLVPNVAVHLALDPRFDSW